MNLHEEILAKENRKMKTVLNNGNEEICNEKKIEIESNPLVKYQK